MESGTKVIFTKEEKEAAAERVYQLVDSLNTAIADLQKVGLDVQIHESRNIFAGKSSKISAHVYEHVCFDRKQKETEE